MERTTFSNFDLKGVSGFTEAQDNLEKVSAMKAGIDEQKGQTLEEMSGMVSQLTMKISERKARYRQSHFGWPLDKERETANKWPINARSTVKKRRWNCDSECQCKNILASMSL